MSEFDPYDNFNKQEESAPIQVDLYGFKLSGKPSPTDDASSRITLRGLRDDVTQSLLRICRDSVGFLADVFTGARSVIRGISALPAAVTSRIGRAHQLSEQRESSAQEKFSTRTVTEESKAASVEQLEDILNEFRAQGIPVRLDHLPSGQIAISLVRPELEDVAPEIATDAVAGYLETIPRQTSRSELLDDVLNIPVTTFALSVRTRTLLLKMGIRNLGDLTHRTEKELLATKNFGQTSLLEVRQLLASKDLEVGQFAHESPESSEVTLSPDEGDQVTPVRQELLDRPIHDLRLSRRASRTMLRLGLATIGELIRKSADDLLESKNFGVTTLNEVRDKLSQLGLKLAND